VGSSSSPLGTVLLVAAFGLLVLMFMRTRRAQRDAVTTQNRIGPGAEIMTTSGLYATVVSVEGDVMVLETSGGQQSRWDRRAVARILTPSVQPGTDAAENPSEGGDAARSGDEEPPPGRE
jgi:preprotein translocase subunit YajC